MKRNAMSYYHISLKLLNAILLSSCSYKLIGFPLYAMERLANMQVSDQHSCLREAAAEQQLCSLIKQRALKQIFFHCPALKQQKGGSLMHLFLCWLERRVRVNDYWLASRGVGVRGLLTASLSEWLLLALLSMSCTTQVSGCPWQMLFASPVHYLWGAGWPLGLTANMQVDAYQFKLRGGPPKDQGM